MDLLFADARQLHNVSGEVAHVFNIFPRKILASEVTARRRAAVHGVQQVQLLDDARRVRSYALRTAAAKQSSSQMPVPKVFTSTMTGSFSPMAYASVT